MKKTFYILISIFISINFLKTQNFGQNKVQYKNFKWNFIQSANFDIYYYDDGQKLAEFTSEAVEKSYNQVSTYLDWKLKKRVSIIVYNSHNDFQQTNVILPYMPEGVGGVTELYKNRIVIPFEGSYEAFRHVIHHELVHAVINDLAYGGRAQNIISNRIQLTIPLWMNEGLCEYLSSQWDTRADMTIRDIAINDVIPTIPQLNYYLAYKGGQSVWKFIVEKYGWQKVAEIFKQAKRTQNVEKAFEKTIGMNFVELTEQWHKYIKKEYWPDINGRSEIKDFSQKITDHEKLSNYFNISPALSPDGNRIALITDRSGYSDVIIISAEDGKEIRTIVKGNRSPDFEELKLLQPGISWSPNGEKIVLASKAGGSDALFLIDVKNGKREKLTFDLSSIFTAKWSPDGQKIAFVGNKSNASDIYVYDFKTKKILNLTKDVFSDSEPSWSFDSKKIVFISDRGENINKIENFDISKHDYSQTDIYIYNLTNNKIERITKSTFSENFPTFSNKENKLIYTSDNKGVWNLYVYDLDENTSFPISNVLTGVFQPSLSRDDSKLVFSGYSNRGWDIYSINNPFKDNNLDVKPSNFILNGKDKDPLDLSTININEIDDNKNLEWSSNSFSNWIFAPEYAHYNDGIFDSTDLKKEEPLKLSSYKNDDGSYVTQSYKTKFGLDLVSGQYMYSNTWGSNGTTIFSFSDILGDHRILIGTEMVMDLSNSDYSFQYNYLKPRNDYAIGISNISNIFGSQWNFLRSRYFLLGLNISRPISRFQRFGIGLSNHSLSNKEYILSGYNQYAEVSNEKLSVLSYSLNWTYDNSQFGLTGPSDGSRGNIQFNQSIAEFGYPMDFKTIQVDARRYFRIGKLYTFAFRSMGGISFGKNPQRFFLGGTQNWLFGNGFSNGVKDNSRWNQESDADIWNRQKSDYLKDLYFSVFVLPVRGARLVEKYGNKVFLTNFEFRFPFVNYLALGFPFRVIFGNINGAIFVDAGAAWEDEFNFSSFNPVSGMNQFDDFIASYGYGLRLNIGYSVLRLDIAKDYLYGGETSPWQYYFSLGADI